MSKITRKKKVKKEKVSRKKKIKEISKEKLKKFEKELKEIKLKIKVPEQTEDTQKFQEEPVVNLEEFLRDAKAPVLERVAVAEETQTTTGIMQTRDRETENQAETNYASTSSDYADITTTSQGTTVNNPQYTEATNTFRNSQNDKEHRETKALFRRDDYSAGSEQNSFERTINPEIEDTNETRKYFTKGDQK